MKAMPIHFSKENIGIRFPFRIWILSDEDSLSFLSLTRKSRGIQGVFLRSTWRNVEIAEAVCSVIDYTDWGIGIALEMFHKSLNLDHLLQDKYASDVRSGYMIISSTKPSMWWAYFTMLYMSSLLSLALFLVNNLW